MKISRLLRAGGLAVVPAVVLLTIPLGGCAQEKKAPVGGVLDYDPADDPSIQAAEEYMEGDRMDGMEQPD